MAQILSIQDTHKLDYKNATVTARRYGTTTPIPFFQSDGTTLGLEVYINSQGYLCNQGGSLYTSGVFVHERSEITVTLRNGSSTSWIVTPDESEQIHDGKLYGEDPNNPGQLIEIFSANSENPGYLAWENILRKPSFNIWYESETVVKMTVANDTIDSNISDLSFTKTLTILKDASLALPQSLTIVPNSERTGQRISVRNLTGFPILLKNSDNTTICLVEPSDADTDRIKQVVLFGSTDHKLHLVGDAEFYPDVVSINTVTGFTSGITIGDSTSDIVQVAIDNIIRSTMMATSTWTSNLELPITMTNTSQRKVKIWLQNNATYGGLSLTYAGIPVCIVNNYDIVELVLPGKTDRDNGVRPTVTWRSSTGYEDALPKSVWDDLFTGMGNARRLPIGLGSVETDTGAYNHIVFYLDNKSKQNVFAKVNNTYGGVVQIDFANSSGVVFRSYNQSEATMTYAIVQKGENYFTLGRVGTGVGTEDNPVQPDSSLVYSDLFDGSEISVNLAYIVDKGWLPYFGNNFGSSYDIALLTLDVPEGASHVTLDIKSYMSGSYGYTSHGALKIQLAVPGGSGVDLVTSTLVANPGASHIQGQRLKATLFKSGTTLSITSTEVLP